MKKPWLGKKLVVTAGPTREALDPVRFLSNASSGRMGYALAAEARRLGARVVLISGPTALPAPRGVRLVPVVSALDMLRASLRHGLSADAFIGAAAVADWRPARPSRRKLKKSAASARPVIALRPNPDILKAVAAKRRGRPLLAGFALETENILKNARAKLQAKGLDLIVANGPDALEKGSSRAWVLGPDGKASPFRGSKVALAGKILAALAGRMPRGS